MKGHFSIFKKSKATRSPEISCQHVQKLTPPFFYIYMAFAGHCTQSGTHQNKGIEDIMDIDFNCPYLLPVFWETTSHLTSKLNVMDGRTDGKTGGFYFFNVENSIKREIRKNCFSKKKKFNTPPPPRIFVFYSMKYWKKKYLKFYFIQYLKNS